LERILIKILKILLLFVLLPVGCDNDDNPVVQTASECKEGFVENPNYQEDEDHQFCVPEEFVFHISALSAYYLFENTYFDENLILDDDWIASFNEDVCVGAIRWGDCPEVGSCVLIASGSISGDPTENSSGYLETGDTPEFKIYIATEHQVYDASTFETISTFNNLVTQELNYPLVACSEGIPNSEGNCD